MALSLQFETSYGEIWNNAYWRVSFLRYDDYFKSGVLSFYVWPSEIARQNNKNFISIKLILHGVESVAADGSILTLSYYDVAYKEKKDIYNYLKTTKIKFRNKIYNLSKAVDC